jgi:hypothetical protein
VKQVAALLALAVIAGGCSQASGQEPATDPTSSPYPVPPPGDVVVGPPYPTNANGMTYGSGMGDQDPDLIAAYGTHGQFGYVLATDVYQPIPAGLHVGEVGHPHSITLYAKDGVTTIGVYRIRRGSGGTPTD